jgi:CRISPR system CASCADE complex protein casC
MNRVFLDLHVIQTVPPSNINRDDTGSPKTAQYGGVRRARVSSQSWKKAMRDYFLENCEEEKVGVRTLDLVNFVKEKILSIDNSIIDKEAEEKSADVLKNAGITLKDNKTKALFFMGNSQAEKLAKAAIAGEKDKNKLQEIIKNNPAIDISLFGRMVADDPSLNEDASAQVAHAISTHAIQTEFDFFTAVDDRSGDENAGAGMLGTIEYNSSTLYRYANVAVHELLNQLKDEESTVNTLKLFVKAFANSMPTGKVNSFANQTLPQLLLLEIREDRPVNFVNAFENPIKSRDGYVSESIHRLFETEKNVNQFSELPINSYYVIVGDENIDTNSVKLGNMKELLTRMEGNLSELLRKVGD